MHDPLINIPCVNAYIEMCMEIKKRTNSLRSLNLHSVFLVYATENYDNLGDLIKKVSSFIPASVAITSYIAIASFPGRFFSERTERRKKGLVSIAWVIVRMRQI